ncbi:MAG: septum formation initiator family protein [Anaerofustis sp.]
MDGHAVRSRQIRKKKKMKVKKSCIQSSAVFLVLIAVFFLYSSVLVYERNSINNLDSQVMQLQSDYDKITKTNADLEGKLLSARNLNDIEQYAVNVLGMVQSNSGNITYVSYTDTQTENAQNNQNDIAFLSWVSDLFN